MNSLRKALLLILAVGAASCGYKKPTDQVQPPTGPEARQRYAVLIGLTRSQHPELKAEYERLLVERSTPLALDEIQSAGSAASSVAEGSREPLRDATAESAMVRLTNTFPAFTRNALAEQLASVYPVDSFHWGPEQLTKARDIRRRYEVARRKFREDLAAAESGFGIRASDGPLVDLSFLDAIHIGCRLEGTLAADALADGQPDEALQSVQIMLRAAALLSREWHMACRLAAVRQRTEALHALGAVVAHPQATHANHRAAGEMFAEETANWPSDSQAWIGDRASGLIMYELVRSGYYLSLLSREETEQLAKQEILRVSAKTALRNVDADEAFYLAAMRRLVEACRVPYYQREPSLKELQAELQALRDSPGFPLIAGRMLLDDFELAMHRQAEDSARCRAWSLAFQLVLNPSASVVEINPLTGHPFVVEQTADAVQVTSVLHPTDEPVIIPQRPAVRTARSRNPPPIRQ